MAGQDGRLAFRPVRRRRRAPLPLKFGLPDAMTKEGREVNRKLFTGQLKVRGLFSHPAKLARLNKLLSVV